MRHATLVLVALLVSAFALRADADKKKKAPRDAPPPAAPAPPAPAGPPAPGQCVYELPGVKRCATLNGAGSFDVLTFPPALAVIIFEDDVLQVNPPPTQYYQVAAQGKTVTVAPIVSRLPPTTPMVVTTASVSVTINLKPGSATSVDTQLFVNDPERAARLADRGAELDRREAELRKREAELEKAAIARADQLLLEDLARHGAAERGVGGKGITSNSALIVLEGEKIVRLGQRRYLLVIVDNQSDRAFKVSGVKLSVEGGAGPLKAPWSFARPSIAPGDRVRGAVLLPVRKSGQKTTFKVRVEEADAARSVELGGIQAP